ncbi:ACF3 [Candida pseudojiufengensis]|uniref:ACF3 n=1 Tax=Candida pseudojiufengensis TaxID=497109 RepID=UPI002224869C|nr:ACF3 [Candida pseudojiufengensis]KAI5966241.1 ACF3 [Candida pseudojiufengensis]
MNLKLLLAALSSTLVIAEKTVTKTQTQYIDNQCLKNIAQSLLPNNPENLSTGIPITFVHVPNQALKPKKTVYATVTNTHIVYETVYPTANSIKTENQIQNEVETYTQTTDTTYTLTTHSTSIETSKTCSNNKCITSAYTITVPHVYTITGQATFTTTSKTLDNQQQQSGPSTIETAHETSSSTIGRNTASLAANAGSISNSISSNIIPTSDVPIGVTTSSTIFSATSSLESTYSPSATLEPLSTTRSIPVTSQSVVSESRSITIDLSSITDGLTLSTSSASILTVNENSTLSSTISSSSQLSAIAPDSVETNDLPSDEDSETAAVSVSTGYTLSTIILTSSSTLAPYANSSSYIVSTYQTVSTILQTSSILPSSQESSYSSQDFFESESDYESATESAFSSSSSLSSSSSSSSSSSLSSSSSSSSSSILSQHTLSAEDQICYSGDLFAAIDISSPPYNFSRQELPLAIPSGVNNKGVAYQTNKFYANLFLGNQDLMVYTYPYGVYWSKNNYYGFGVQHTNTSNRVFGSINTNNEGVASYYFNPTNNGEIIFSATIFDNSVAMGVTDMTEMGVKVTLSKDDDEINNLEIPIVQGMGFVSAIYNGNLIAELNSLYGIRTLILEDSNALLKNILKYRAILFNGVEWLIYATLPVEDSDFELTVKDPYHLEASKSIDGLIIQVAIAPTAEGDPFYDAAAGMYVTDASFQGSVVCSQDASYEFVYETKGTSSSGNPIIFALPHHLSTLTSSGATGIKVASQTKGDMTGFLTKKLSFSETIDKKIQFLPYLEGVSSPSYSIEQLTLLAKSANEELAVDIASTVKNMNSNYFSGKVLDKYAQILLVVSEIIQDDDVTLSTLNDMKEAFEIFVANKQYYPLMYDLKFGGITSTAAQNGDDGADFGSAYYNDHHFHYGYFIHAAAVVGLIDKKLNGTWAEDNKAWVNSLVRDAANPSRKDYYFPVSRMFSWYDGHSWAAGLYASNDGKNQESSSEDIHFAYGMKLWGKVVGDYSMEARGGLMLSIMNRAFNMYFYYKSDNQVQPSEILPNKVSGIFFENKIDYTTYFGTPKDHPEYVHGIHMLPITAASSSIRIPSYVQEEWDDQISTFVNNVNDGWAGILRLNQAIIDPHTSYEFFSSNSWTNNYLDNGQSRTWSLAFAGGFA